MVHRAVILSPMAEFWLTGGQKTYSKGDLEREIDRNG